jgi:hypothetical protein
MMDTPMWSDLFKSISRIGLKVTISSDVELLEQQLLGLRRRKVRNILHLAS